MPKAFPPDAKPLKVCALGHFVPNGVTKITTGGVVCGTRTFTPMPTRIMNDER